MIAIASAAVLAVVASPLASGAVAAEPTTTDVVVDARITYQRVPVADLDDPAGLAGVAFELYTPAEGGPGTPTGFTCAIPEGATDCTISVPDTGPGGANAGRQYSVVVTDAGAVADPIDGLMTGTSSEPFTFRQYPGLTPPVTGGSTIAFPTQGTEELINSGVVALPLQNPSIASLCSTGALSLAVQMDISGSVSSTQRAQYRAAFEGLVADLAGTPVELSLSTFGSSSPVDGRASGPYSLEDPAEVEALNGAIAAYTESVPGPTQQTNWDLALRKVADAPTDYDALLFLTDGAPNYVSNDTGTGGQGVSGSSVTIASLEQAVFSANAVKSEGTRVIAMGIGNGVSGEVYRNLAAISGPVANSDYYQGDWDTLALDLGLVVSPLTCRVPVTVTKIIAGAPADDWSFSASASDVSSGTAVIDGENPQLTGSGENAPGTANWTEVFDDGDATSTLTLTETGQAGFAPVSAEYTVHHLDGTTTSDSVDASLSLVIPDVAPTDRVEATFTNAPSAVLPATFVVRKVLSGNGVSKVPGDTAFQVDYSVNGVAAAAPLTIRADGTPVTSPVLAVGDQIAFAEQTPPAVAGVTWGTVPTIAPISLTAAPITVDVANSVTLVANGGGGDVVPPANGGATGGSTALAATGSPQPLPWIGAGFLLLAAGAAFILSRRRTPATD